MPYEKYGNTFLDKQTPSIGTQQPTPAAPVAPSSPAASAPPTPGTSNAVHESTLYSADTQKPVDVHERDKHRHLGHNGEHPVGLRHRKISQDPLHGEEDKLYDELKDLRDKATQGACSPQEMMRMTEVQGQLSAINNTRMSQAREVLGGELTNDASQPAQGVHPMNPIQDQDRGASGYNPKPNLSQPIHDPEGLDRSMQPSPGMHTHRLPGQGKLDNDANEMGAPGSVPNSGGVDNNRMPRVPRPISI